MKFFQITLYCLFSVLFSFLLSVQTFAEDKTEEEDDAPQPEVVSNFVQPKETLEKILKHSNADNAFLYIKAVNKVVSKRSVRTGQRYELLLDPLNGKIIRFEYDIDNLKTLIVQGLDQPKAKVENADYDIKLSLVQAEIQDNLFKTLVQTEGNFLLASKLTDIFASEINFAKDLRKGDSFAVLVEKRYQQEVYKGYGRIMAARFINKGKEFEAFLFSDAGNRPQYYNHKGQNLKKTFLQSPLAVTRLTSGFSFNRMHPVLGYSRPHLGVDYAAPTGTPVKAVADGEVVRYGWVNGYGNQIVLKHAEGLESWYSHLSAYIRGLRNGQHIEQGRVIGFVGATGLATGSHLDFRLRKNEQFLNPAKLINPRGLPVATQDLKKFKQVMTTATEYLNGQRNLSEYTPESLVPRKTTLAQTMPQRKQEKTLSKTRKNPKNDVKKSSKEKKSKKEKKEQKNTDKKRKRK